MTERSPAEVIFFAALEKIGPEQRAAYLEAACGENVELRRRVELMLEAHPKVGDFMATGSFSGEAKEARLKPSPDHAGAVIAGKYKLLEKIGEGGMGEVWVADQLEPIKRRVALKLIKRGMDSRSVLARFEAERQALGVMDHPNIAKVLDGGTTETGQPYFVMELVKGTPITEFCDARRLTAKQRLALFIPVCQAIQHAHQKGIIHRDIKPSNVLVALHDETPVPKVIDFGVAKAVGQQLTEKTIYTGFGNLVGTPAYMAPEQATFNQLDIDTRADVYALGVLLYELLAGSPPVEPERLKRAALDEVLRIVRDEEPPRPSVRFSTSEGKASIAAMRQIDPMKLSALMRGEIDWIVMKALEKDRSRRYETANGFAADIRRYLDGEAIQAHPPSASYRLSKFVKRHRVVIATVSAFVGMLIAAVGISGTLAIKATRARTEAEKNARLYLEASTEGQRSRLDAEFRAIDYQIDLDLEQLKNDTRVGLLRLARPRKTEFDPFPFQNDDDRKAMPFSIGDRFQPLQEFVAAAVITVGQLKYARLRPPLTQEDDQLSYVYSPDGSTFLTWGPEEKRLQLWDSRKATLKGKLYEDDEDLGDPTRLDGRLFSPDSKTILTRDVTGMIRCWSTETAKLLSRIDGSHSFYDTSDNKEIKVEHVRTMKKEPYIRALFQNEDFALGNNRLITERVKAKRRPETGDTKIIGQEFAVRVELWDTQTGKLITRLDRPESGNATGFRFANESKWVVGQEGKSKVVIYSANDGREITRLVHHTGGEFLSFDVSPNGKRVVVSAKRTENGDALYVWESNPWRLLPRISELQPGAFRQFLTDDQALITTDAGNSAALYDFDASNPLWNLDVLDVITKDGFLWDRFDAIYDIKTKLRLIAPPGHKFPPVLARLAQDGRFVKIGSYELIDSVTEKSIPQEQSYMLSSEGALVGFGAFFHFGSGAEYKSAIFPAPRFLKISPELLQLWIQVAVRGELGPAGRFIPWNEETWQKKQRELAAFTPPHPEFPFPGYLATDKLHWLRAEFEAAPEDKKRPLAQALLHRTEQSGNEGEAKRWRAWLNK